MPFNKQANHVFVGNPPVLGQQAEKHHCVLVVDDDNVVRLLLRTQLQKAGFRVYCAEDGETALLLFDRERPDVVLLDVMMPGIDGFHVCEAIRAHVHGAHTPVVMMTGLEDMDSIHRAYQAGATDFATKPINCPVLVQRLRYMMRANATLTQLRRSRYTLESAQSLANLGYLEINPESKQCHFSVQIRGLKAMTAGSGLSDMEWLEQTVRPEDVPRFYSVIAEMLAAPEPGSMTWEQAVHLLDDTIRIFQVHIAIIDDELEGGRRILGTTLDITERKQSEQRIRRLAFFDQLTGLPNRVLLTEYLKGCVSRAQAAGRAVAVLAIDLDLFNRINNSLGQAAGDAVLRQIAKRLYACAPFNCSLPLSEWLDAEPERVESDMVARLGGDTFVAVLNHLDSHEDAMTIAHQLSDAIRQPLRYGAHELFLSASVGVAWYPEAGQDGATLLRNADMAMHSAKARGRSAIQLYRQSLTEDVATQLSLHNDLRRALERGELELHYQPKLSFPGGELAGFEALLRWNHPQRGRVPPDQFIRLAEESGLIVDIGMWVLQKACEQFAEWLAQGLPPVRIAVNLSPRQLREADVVQRVAEVLRSTGMKPEMLELEITEQTLMDDFESGHSVVTQFRELGIHIALDDFGTGFSSLSYLLRFPIDTLKIDRCFVHNIGEEPQKSAIVSAVAQLSRKLDIAVVAEGIETEGDMRVVSELGCDQGQGYHICRPLPVAELAVWLEHFFSQRNPQLSAVG